MRARSAAPTGPSFTAIIQVPPSSVVSRHGHQVLGDPAAQLPFRQAATGSSDNNGDDVRLFCFDFKAVQTQDDRHCKKRNPLVAVVVRMVRYNAESVSSGQSGEIGRPLVRPLVAGPGESGLESVLVANARQASVLPQLIE